MKIKLAIKFDTHILLRNDTFTKIPARGILERINNGSNGFMRPVDSMH